MNRTTKFYTFFKDYEKKFLNKINEFSFDNDSYSLLEIILFENNNVIWKKWLNDRKIYYLNKWDFLPVLWWTRTWLINKSLIKIFEEEIWKEKLYKEVEFLPVKLISEESIIWWQIDSIDNYFILNVINKITDTNFKVYSDKIKEYDFLMIDKYLNKIIFSEEIKNILEKQELKIYYIDWVYEF